MCVVVNRRLCSHWGLLSLVLPLFFFVIQEEEQVKLMLSLPHISPDAFPRFMCRVADVVHVQRAWRDTVECHEYMAQAGDVVKDRARIRVHEGQGVSVRACGV